MIKRQQKYLTIHAGDGTVAYQKSDLASKCLLVAARLSLDLQRGVAAILGFYRTSSTSRPRSISEVDEIKGQCLSLPMCFMSTLLVVSRSHNCHLFQLHLHEMHLSCRWSRTNMAGRLHMTTVHEPATLVLEIV